MCNLKNVLAGFALERIDLSEMVVSVPNVLYDEF